MARVAQKIALITGAARGIGATTAELLAREGSFVILTDILDEEGQALVDKIGAHTAAYYHLDVSKESEWEKLCKVIQEKHGRLDILFNNAGVIGLDSHLGPQDPEHCSLDTWHHVHQINLDGIFLGCRYGIALMKKTGGSIINMSSRSGIVGIPLACAYASSKAAVRNHSKSVALYCASKHYGIRCNSLHPGAILTPMWEPMFDPSMSREEAIRDIGAGIPLGHMGEALDVAYAVLYLGSDESKYITGAEFTLDGGILAGSSAAPSKPK